MSTDPGNIKGHEILQRVVAQALADEDYRQRLIDDPKSALREAGLVVADELELVIHENSPDRLHLVLPSRLQDQQQLDIDELDVTLLVTTHF